MNVMKQRTRKLLSMFLAVAMVVGLFPTSAFAAVAPKADPPAPAYQLVAGEQNGNGHFGSASPEAFVLSAQDFTNEAFSFVLKLNSENAKTRFRFVTKYVSDTNWAYIGYDGASGWFCEFKTDAGTNWPNLALPKLADGAEVKLSGVYAEDGLHLTLVDMTSGQTLAETVANDPVFLTLKDQAGKVGFGAAKYGAEVTDVTVSGLTVGETVFDDAAYKAMIPYADKIGSWGPVASKPDPKPEPEPDPEPQKPELITWARLVSGAGNGNGHFGSAAPEAFVLTAEKYTNEPFSFVVKFNSETDATRFRFVTKYIDDSNWSYVAFDGYQGKNHWFTEYKDNGNGGWPDVSGLPVLNKGDEIKFSGKYEGSDLKLTVENLTTNEKGTATIGHAGVKADQAGQLGFGAAQWGKVSTDISVRDFAVGEKVFDKAAYQAMVPYKDLIGSWTIEEVKPADPNEGKLWYRITTGSKNSNSHNYGDSTKNAPALALDQSRNMTVGKTVSMTIKPSDNFAMFYTYLDDSNWLYVGYDKSSKWYYQYKINGQENWPGIPGLPDPVPGEELTMSVALDRETLVVNVNGKEVKVPNSSLLPFSEQENLKNNGRFGVKTLGTLEFTDVMLGQTDCMADTWGFAADREGQALTQFRSVVRPLTGFVRNNAGEPIANASVSVGGKSATTDETGAYIVNGLELGTYSVAVSAAGFAPYKGEVVITEAAEHELNVVLEPKGELDLTQFDSITDGAGLTVYIGKTFPVVARYVLEDGSFFRGNEDAAIVDSIKINNVMVAPQVTVLSTGDSFRDYRLTVKAPDVSLDLYMDVRIEAADGTLTWQVTNLVKNEGCAPIATIDFTQLNLLSVSTSDKGACFDGATMSSNTTVSGDRHVTFDNGFNPGSRTAYLYAFLTNGVLSAGLESNSTVEGDKRLVRNDGADYMALTSNVFYYERGDNNGQNYMKKHPATVYPVCELPCMKVAIGGDVNQDGDVDWNDGALAYRKVMHRAYQNEVIKDIVNYRIVMNFASMHPDPYLQTADNVKKVFLATDGLPQALLLKGYGNEGHDSANSEYADIAERQGGVEDFQKLIQIAHDYNTEVGIHINAQEAYPESKSFCPEMIGGPNGMGNGWGWLDQSHVIDKHWDLASGARWQRLVQLYDRINNTSHLNLDWDKGEYVLNARGTVDATMEQLKAEGESLPDNMDFIYLDVWYQDSWESREIAKQVNSLGWRFSTEFATACEYDSTWQHWATEGSYGGAAMKGFNSDIIRFIRNDQRDSQVLNYPQYGGTADNPLLGGFQLKGFEGWGSQRDFGDYIVGTFNDNLPTKFLQHYIVTDWETYAPGESPVGNHEKQITLANEAGDTVVVTRNEAQRSDNNIERTITLNGKVVLNDVTYLLPWTDNQNGTEKLYHWNLEGGETTWTLQPSWASNSALVVYKLTDQGRVEPKTVSVTNGKITLTAEPATAYVVVPSEEVKTLKNDFGEMDYVVDPGFNGYAPGSKLDKADWTGDVDDPSVTVEISVTDDQRLQFASPEKDVAVSTTLRNLIPGKDYVAEIYVQNDTNLPATLEVDAGEKVVSVWAGHSYVKNYVRCDNKSAYSYMQRMQVSFVAESDTAVLTLKRAAGEGNTYMDGIRIVQKKLDNYQPDGSFKQDFESVVQGLYPFVLGPAQGVDDPRTHLAQKHAPYTQYGWNDRVVDDVIQGDWSLKHHNQSSGIIYQTLPQNFRFEPGKFYTVEFDYQTGSDRAYAMVIGDDEVFYTPDESQLLPVTGGKTLEDGTVVGNTQHYKMLVQGAEDGNTWIGLYSPGGVAGGAFGQMDFILDNLVIREDTTSVLVSLSANRLYKGETASVTVISPDPDGRITEWANTNPEVAVVEDNVVKALSAGTTTLTASLSDGTTKVFEITVIAEENIGLHGVGATANTEERGGEGPVNGYANAAADGNESTFWHSAWSSGNFKVSESNPAVIKVDLGADYAIKGFKFQQRPSGPNGTVKKYSYRILDAEGNELLVGEPAAVPAAQQTNGKWTEIPFTEALAGARYIELSVLEGHGGFASLAEIQAMYHVVVADQAVVDPISVRVDEYAVASVKPAAAGTVLKGMVWSSSDPEIFTVDENGLVLPQKAGTATLISSNAAGVRAEATVTVVGVDSITLSKAPDYVLPSAGVDTALVEITVNYTDGSSKPLPGALAKVDYDQTTCMLTVTYMDCSTEAKYIPMAVETLDFTMTAPVAMAEAPLTLDADAYTGVVTWDGKLVDGKFDYDTVYTAAVTLTAKDDRVFTAETVVTGLANVQVQADGTLTGSVTFPATKIQNNFTDVKPDDYFYAPVQWAVENKVTAGISDTEFGTELSCTRAQAVTFLWNAAGQPDPESTESPFADVAEDAWYFKAVLWAAEQGITVGISDTEFGPDLVCTRAETMTFLWKYMSKPAAKADVSFTDVTEADWFYAPVQWAVENNITAGVGNNMFGSEDVCLRTDFVTFLYRAFRI